MRHHILNQPAHQVVGERKRLRALVQRPHLNEVPVREQVHDVVIHVHFTLENLPRAWIDDLAAVGVLGGRWPPVDRRIAGVVHGEVGILFLGGRHLAEDGVAEPRLLEGLLPAVHALLDPRLQPLGGGRIDPVDDRLDRVGDRAVRVLLVESEAPDDASGLRPMFRPAVVDVLVAVEPDPGIAEPGHHRVVRKAPHAPVDGGGLCAGPSFATATPSRPGRSRRPTTTPAARGRARATRLDGLDLDVVRERDHVLDPGAIRLNALDTPHLGVRRRVKAGHVDDRRAVRSESLDREAGDDRPLPHTIHVAGDIGLSVGSRRVEALPEQDLVPVALPHHVPVHAGPAGEARSLATVGYATPDQEHLLAQLALRDLEEEILPDHVGLEHPLTGHGFLSDDLIVGLWSRILLLLHPPSPASAPATAGGNLNCQGGGRRGWASPGQPDGKDRRQDRKYVA